jgi:hypothetical protein
MASLLERVFGEAPLFQREQAGASIIGTGTPAATVNINAAADTGAVNMDAELSKAGSKYTAKRASIPAPGSIDDLIGVIKAVRNQYQVRGMLEDTAAYITEGFRVKPAPGKWEDVQRFCVESDIHSKVARLALELITVGWAVVYVSEMDKQGFPGITILHNCTVTRGVDGKHHIFLKLSDNAKDAIRSNPKLYPRYWQGGLDSSDGIDITRVYDKSGKWKQGGAYYVSLEPEGEDVYPISPLYPVLGDAVDAERHGKVLGDLMDLVKWYYFQIRIGNDKGQDERDGRIKAISKDRVQQVAQSFGMGIKSGAIVTPGDVNAEHHSPEKSPWEMPRNEREALKDVFKEQIGLPSFENASSDAAARMLAKSFLPKREKLRDIIVNKFVLPFLLDMGSRFPQMQGAYYIYGKAALEDLGTLVNLHRELYNTGAYSLQTINEMLDPDYNFEREMAQKKFEAKSKDLVGNLYEVGQGVGSGMSATANPDKKGISGDPKSADPKTQAQPGSQPGRPSK